MRAPEGKVFAPLDLKLVALNRNVMGLVHPMYTRLEAERFDLVHGFDFRAPSLALAGTATHLCALTTNK